MSKGAQLEDDGQALEVMLFLDPACACDVGATSKTGVFARAACSGALWSEHAGRVFGLAGASACSGPKGESCEGDWAKAFALWHASACGLSVYKAAETPSMQSQLPLPAPWLLPWWKLQQWLGQRSPQVLRTLRPPVKQEVLEKFQAGFDSSAAASAAVAGLWQICDGQDAAMERSIASMLGMTALQDDEWGQGLFGGYNVYEHTVCSVLLPLESAMRLTALLHEKLPGKFGKTKLAFACSFNTAKIFLVDVSSGDVFVWTAKGPPNPNLEYAAPPAPSGPLSVGAAVVLRDLTGKPELNGKSGSLVAFDDAKGRWQVKLNESAVVSLFKPENLKPVVPAVASAVAAAAAAVSGQPGPSETGLLRWFQEYVRRLEANFYEVRSLRNESAPDARGICLYPVSGPEVSCCVTRGVEVTASPVYMPEHQQGWSYSIGFRLVGTPEERGFKTCQLHVRTWKITEDGRETQTVRGEGVIGFFPILVDGGYLLNKDSDPHNQYENEADGDKFMEGTFRYQSCSGRLASMLGSFGGELTFVPGTVKSPTGPPFQAQLEDFRLRVPEFKF